MKRILCKIGIHNWEIRKWVRFKDSKGKSIAEEGFDRECDWCEKVQRLKKPKKYHPSKYVWTNI